MDQHRDLNNEDPLAAEKDALLEGESVNTTDPDVADTDEGEAPESEVGGDTKTAAESSGDIAEPAKAGKKATKKPADKAEKPEKKAKTAPTKPKKRSARHQAAASKVDIKRRYSVKDAIALAKETAYGKFDGSLDLHIRLITKKSKTDSGERFRLVVALPHGTGKEKKVGVLDEALIEKIKTKGDTDFDILLATPAMMPKVAQIAKILGPKGKMPNPKTGTVAEDLEAAKRAISSGRVELRADAHNIIHQAIGRVSWSAEQLTENYRALVGSIPVHRLQKISLAATMGPGIEIDLTA